MRLALKNTLDMLFRLARLSKNEDPSKKVLQQALHDAQMNPLLAKTTAKLWIALQVIPFDELKQDRENLNEEFSNILKNIFKDVGNAEKKKIIPFYLQVVQSLIENNQRELAAHLLPVLQHISDSQALLLPRNLINQFNKTYEDLIKPIVFTHSFSLLVKKIKSLGSTAFVLDDSETSDFFRWFARTQEAQASAPQRMRRYSDATALKSTQEPEGVRDRSFTMPSLIGMPVCEVGRLRTPVEKEHEELVQIEACVSNPEVGPVHPIVKIEYRWAGYFYGVPPQARSCAAEASRLDASHAPNRYLM